MKAQKSLSKQYQKQRDVISPSGRNDDDVVVAMVVIFSLSASQVSITAVAKRTLQTSSRIITTT